MLRWLVLALVVANIGFCSWRGGSLDSLVGARAQGDREPERLSRQVRPEVLRVMPAASAAAAMRAEPVLACLEAGPYTPAQIASAESALQLASLPAGSWVSVKGELPAVWIVYMGRYPTRDAMEKKVEELRRRRVEFEEVRSPAELAGGLSLGRYDNRGAADAALADFNARGIRTARVEMLSPPATVHMLRAERADADVRNRLGSLRADSLFGKPFAACAPRP